MSEVANYCESLDFLDIIEVTLSMFKFLSIAILGVILYRLIFPPRRIDQGRDQRVSDDDYIDYEEVD